MRKIKLSKWKSNVPIFEGEGENRKLVRTEQQDEDLLTAINVLIANKKPEDMPRGLDKFRTFNRLSKSFSKAEKSRVLELEEVDYTFLKETIEKDVPSAWGMNENIAKAIEDFLDAKQEK